MYMGVILEKVISAKGLPGAPHVYGCDPVQQAMLKHGFECSPCIWG